MATGDKNSPDLNDALDLFVGDTHVPGSQTASATNRKRPNHKASAGNKQKNMAAAADASKRRSDSVGNKPISELRAIEKTTLSSTSEDEERTASQQTVRPTTRMGRPPGIKSGSGRPKDKTSLSLDLELMDYYRDQTWQEQCQLGELVERALEDYAARTWKWEPQE